MLLGSRSYSYGDIRKVQVNYSGWLKEGYVLKSVTANISPTTGITSTVSTITLDPTEMTAYIQVNCGSVNESFTLNVIATDTFGQTINDQILINIVAPGAIG